MLELKCWKETHRSVNPEQQRFRNIQPVRATLEARLQATSNR